MNCRAFEPLIALYAGRDLDDSTTVEEHLAECPECRQLLEDLQSSQAALKEWASDPVDAAFLTAVRSGVLSRVDRPRMALWPWVAALSAIAIFLVAMPRQPAPPPPPPPPVQLAAQAPVVEASAPAPKRRKHVVKRKTEPLVVKMLTDDPDIVIIWLTGD